MLEQPLSYRKQKKKKIKFASKTKETLMFYWNPPPKKNWFHISTWLERDYFGYHFFFVPFKPSAYGKLWGEGQMWINYADKECDHVSEK